MTCKVHHMPSNPWLPQAITVLLVGTVLSMGLPWLAKAK